MLHAHKILSLMLVAGTGISAALAHNQQPPHDPATPPAAHSQEHADGGNAKLTAAATFPAKEMSGLSVRNPQGEELGSVEDVVINITNGKVEYVAMSVGGVLGIGDRLFAVPLKEMKFQHGRDEKFFVLNASREKLEKAPGFDKDNWPNFADPQWRDQVDRSYRQSAAERTTETPDTLRTR